MESKESKSTAATAPGEPGMDSSHIGQNPTVDTASPIGQHHHTTNATPQTFFSRFGRPNPLFASAWPFDFSPPSSVVGVKLEKSSHHVAKEEEASSRDDCLPNHDTIQTSTNDLGSHKAKPKQERKETLEELHTSFSGTTSTTSEPLISLPSRRLKSEDTLQTSTKDLSPHKNLREQVQDERLKSSRSASFSRDRSSSSEPLLSLFSPRLKSEDTARTPTNDLSPHKDPSDQVQEKTLLGVGRSISLSGNRSSSLEVPLALSSRRIKRTQGSTIHDNPPEPVLKKTKVKKTVTRLRVPREILQHYQTKAASTSRPEHTKEEMDRHGQSGARRAQKAAEKVKAEPSDQDVMDIDSDDDPSHATIPSPSTFGSNAKSFALNQSSATTTPEDNPASAYAGLTRACKRSSRPDDPNVKTKAQDHDQNRQGMGAEQRRDNRRLDRPHAPPMYARSSTTRPKESHRNVLETRKTHYSAAVYQQFANMPDETKDNYGRSDLETLKAMQPLVQRCIDAVRRRQDTKEMFTELRGRLHAMQYYDFLSKHLIEETKVFELSSVGAILLEKNNLFPWDIQADARLVYKHVFEYGCDPHLLRGIKVTATVEKKNKGYALDKDYPFRSSANYVGAGGLVNGQWWPWFICALRDGAHGATQAGIHGETDKGAYSIVVGGDSGYDDSDEGDTLRYCGTSSPDQDSNGNSIPTAHTTRLLESCDRIHNPIRVLRKAAANGKYTAYKPSCGLRYDGLYKITGKECLHVDTSMYRFNLVRCPGQDPIRHKGPEERPTHQEKARYAQLGTALA
ncbi:MAG: hypothetical protein Q9221_006062 [Calogaya cf. arnoldii]